MALSTWWIAALSSDLPKCAAAARLKRWLVDDVILTNNIMGNTLWAIV